MNNERLERLVERLGIQRSYHDVWGNLHHLKEEPLLAILERAGLTEEGEEAGSVLPPVLLRQEGDPDNTLDLEIPGAKVGYSSLQLTLRDEEGEEMDLEPELTCTIGEPIRLMAFLPRDLERGYYQLILKGREGKSEFISTSRLVVAPVRAWLPEEMLRGERIWGLGLNLYSLNSGTNLGIGDFGDLREMVKLVGDAGGDFLSISPLHMIPNRVPFGVSPYFPLSRLYINPIYIDVSDLVNLEGSEEAERFMESDYFRLETERLRRSRFIDYDGVYSLKMKIFRRAFDDFHEREYLRGTERGEAFRRFCREEGKALRIHALFMVLEERCFQEGLYHWRDWPEGYHDPESEDSRAASVRWERELLFQKYLQWVAEEQISDIQALALKKGMVIGLYTDLALGAPEMSSEVWGRRDLFVRGVTVGAPPDDFSPMGQNWGFPPLRPDRLREAGYDFLIDLFRRNLRRGGAIRIDHILGFFRLFWIPEGFEPGDGIYVGYPWEEILSIISLESMKARTVVIGEDLGTVGEEVRAALRRFGMLSYRLLYFEKDYGTGEFLPPEAYPEWALVSATTHDLPTLAGFWIGRDLEVRRALGRYPDEEGFERDRRERGYDRWRLLRALERQGLLPEGYSSDPGEIPEMTEDLILSIYRYLGRTPSRMLTVNLDDILLVKDQQNLPGTVTEYPNWRRRLTKTVEEIEKSGIIGRLRGIRDR